MNTVEKRHGFLKDYDKFNRKYDQIKIKIKSRVIAQIFRVYDNITQP